MLLPILCLSSGLILFFGGALACGAAIPEKDPLQATSSTQDSSTMKIETAPYGTTPDGQAITLYTLTNSHGSSIQLIDYGAIITSVEVPDRDGKRANINLNYPSLEGYLERHPYFGATVGRFCNRIAGGKFSLDGQMYTLVQNNGPNHLHGGTIGFDKLVWKGEPMRLDEAIGVRLTVVSPDGQEGYPGNLTVHVEFTWNDEHELKIAFRAETDKPTVVNLTNHSYWNLAGANSGDVLEHELQLFCEKYLAVDDTLIPTGELVKVAGTPLDFLQPRKIGERIQQFPMTKGYDHCFVVDGQPGTLRKAAVVREPKSGRVMEVWTTQPGVQLYTGNHLGGKYGQHSGFCLETQHYPDAPNKPQFPTTRLNPGETFEEVTVHRFSVEQ
jgi:aldose 1-epimerase